MAPLSGAHTEAVKRFSEGVEQLPGFYIRWRTTNHQTMQPTPMKKITNTPSRSTMHSTALHTSGHTSAALTNSSFSFPSEIMTYPHVWGVGFHAIFFYQVDFIDTISCYYSCYYYCDSLTAYIHICAMNTYTHHAHEVYHGVESAPRAKVEFRRRT